MLKKKDHYDEYILICSRHDHSAPPRTLREYVTDVVLGGKVADEKEIQKAMNDTLGFLNRRANSFHSNPKYEMAAADGRLKSIVASGEGRTAKEKIMEVLEAAVWYEVPIEIDEIITEEDFLSWKMEWYFDQGYRRDYYPGNLVVDLHEVKAILPNGSVVYGNGGLRRPAGSKRLGKFYMCWI